MAAGKTVLDRVPGPTVSAYGLGFDIAGHRIIGQITETFSPGTITAVLGPSGSGKSTLLKCLATVYRASHGRVRVDGTDLFTDLAGYRHRLGYVPQDDIIHEALKVRSVLQFAARLRLENSCSNATIEKRVVQTAHRLGLVERLGNRVRSLSGGQRKRVNIAVELLATPDLLILDEPASGLDPATEADLLNILRGLAKEQRTVILTTHSMECLEKIDRLMLLHDGLLVFSGTLQELLAHFSVSAPGEVFRTLRTRSAGEWLSQWVGR